MFILDDMLKFESIVCTKFSTRVIYSFDAIFDVIEITFSIGVTIKLILHINSNSKFYRCFSNKGVEYNHYS